LPATAPARAGQGQKASSPASQLLRVLPGADAPVIAICSVVEKYLLPPLARHSPAH